VVLCARELGHRKNDRFLLAFSGSWGCFISPKMPKPNFHVHG
jgi:hypothetical protein